MRKTKTVLSGPTAARKVAKARRTPSASARAVPSAGPSVRIVSPASPKPRRSTSARRKPFVHFANCFAKDSSPLAPLMMTANLFGSAGGRAAAAAHR